MPSQPTNVRIVTNDKEARSGTTKSSSPDLRLSNVTLTSDDLDRLAAALAERTVEAPVEAPVVPAATDDYVTVRRNKESRPMSEF